MESVKRKDGKEKLHMEGQVDEKYEAKLQPSAKFTDSYFVTFDLRHTNFKPLVYISFTLHPANLPPPSLCVYLL